MFAWLKSGCRVESSPRETAEAFQAYLALGRIVAWRVLDVMLLGRECPELAADTVLEPDEWPAVSAVVKGEPPPAAAPPLGEMVQRIASLGGYQGRPRDGPPGPKALWLGMQRLTDVTLGWRARVLEGKPGRVDQKAEMGPARASPDPSARDPTTVQSYGVR